MKKILYRLLSGVAVALLLSGCIHRELIILGSGSGAEHTVSSETNSSAESQTIGAGGAIIPRVAFPESEYRQLKKGGNGTIKGSIYLSDAYGKKTYGKQTRLYLNPVTSYSKQWYQESYIGGYKMAKADKRLYNYLRFTASNSRGKFAFYGVPSGTYYVIGMVKCGKICGYDTARNIRIAKEVTVSGSGSVSVDLARVID